MCFCVKIKYGQLVPCNSILMTSYNPRQAGGGGAFGAPCCFLLPCTLILVNNLKDILLKFIGSGTGWKKVWSVKKILNSP